MWVGWYSGEFSCWTASEVSGFFLTDLQEAGGINSSFYEQAGWAGSLSTKWLSKSVEEYITSNRGVGDFVGSELKLLINNYIISCFFVHIYKMGVLFFFFFFFYY